MIGMLTAGKLVAAILFAGLAWWTSQVIMPLFPEGTDPGLFEWVNTAVGFVVGWVIAGSRAGTGWAAAVSYGLTTVAGLVFWALFLNCAAEMIRLSLRRAYDGPVEAVIGIFDLMVENGQIMIDPTVIGTLVIGGVVAALVVELAGRNFR